jgi:hypothetical protein
MQETVEVVHVDTMTGAQFAFALLGRLAGRISVLLTGGMQGENL